MAERGKSLRIVTDGFPLVEGIFLDCIWLFPFFSQTRTPLFKQRTFLQQVLAEREKCAGGDIKSLCRRRLSF